MIPCYQLMGLLNFTSYLDEIREFPAVSLKKSKQGFSWKGAVILEKIDPPLPTHLISLRMMLICGIY